MSVSGANHNAVITGGSGAFSSSQFDINNASGSWEIDNIAASYKGAHGTLAGESATEIGGVWGMKVPIDTPTPGDPSQAKVMMFLPIIFTVMFINFPSGLVLYWLINNVLSIGQQYRIKKRPA